MDEGVGAGVNVAVGDGVGVFVLVGVAVGTAANWIGALQAPARNSKTNPRAIQDGNVRTIMGL